MTAPSNEDDRPAIGRALDARDQVPEHETPTEPQHPIAREPDGTPTPQPAKTPAQPARAKPERAGPPAWNVALLRGELAFLVVALVGEAVAFGQRLVGGISLPFATTARIGGLYFYLFHHVPVGIQATGSPVKGPFLTVSMAMLTATALAVWLLFRGGRAAGGAMGGALWRRCLAGAGVAIPYAGLSLLMSYAVPLQSHSTRLRDIGIGQLRIAVSHGSALWWPLGIAAVSGLLGGLWSARVAIGRTARGRWGLGALAGSWRMLVYGLGLAFVGLLVLAAVRPQATRSYFQGTLGDGLLGKDALAHHVLALPNQSMWVLVPAMGACDGIRGDRTVDLLCYGSYPRHGSTSDVLLGLFGLTSKGRTPLQEITFGSAPGAYFLFLAVPLLAAVAGGAVTARREQADGVLEGLAIGAAAGVVFALLVGVSSVLADVGLHVATGKGRSITVGPVPVQAALAALAWGVGGGAIGGFLGAAFGARSRAAPTGLATAGWPQPRSQ